jgi:predicted RNase H-like nuclease
MNHVAGADVWKGQWVVVVLEDGRFRSAFVRPTASDVLDALEGVEVLAFDIPIGLPKGNDHRGCDAAARVFVGPRSSSVFPTPPRAVLEAPTYREANRLSKEAAKGATVHNFTT